MDTSQKKKEFCTIFFKFKFLSKYKVLKVLKKFTTNPEANSNNKTRKKKNRFLF